MKFTLLLFLSKLYTLLSGGPKGQRPPPSGEERSSSHAILPPFAGRPSALKGKPSSSPFHFDLVCFSALTWCASEL
uniref:Uncharacterized protein orf75 n=1 Tax=Monomastix sp. (strain OKE-1) TaxID=141716 RepID=C0JWQ5_MONSK|nr:hypothetical protein MoOKC_p071 [Monomastix sp. OKE-1]ACK36924.1 unknown [Monomastix sp. OKE-1]